MIMEQFGKVMKINALSLAALPLLLIATFFKLLAKAFEKITIFLGLMILALIVFALTSTATAPKNLAELIIGFLAFVAIIGVFLFLVGWLLTLASAFIALIWSAIRGVLDSLYETCYNWYLSLFAKAETEYSFLSLNGKKVPNAIACLFFTILKGLSWVITTLVSLSYVLAGIVSVAIVFFTLHDLNGNVKAAFGMNLIQYTKEFELHSAIYGILIYLILIGIIIGTIMALASEWYEWGQELKMTSAQISKEVSGLVKSNLQMASGTTEEVEKNIIYLKKLEEHVNTLDPLSKLVTSVLDRKDNPLLRSYWGIYVKNLDPLVAECSDKKGITIGRFKQLIPHIQMLDRQRSDVEKLASKLDKELAQPTGTSVFFSGCDNLDKLEKRYKALCKTYHPDIAEGDTETFQKMQAEYQRLKAALTAPASKADNKKTPAEKRTDGKKDARG